MDDGKFSSEDLPRIVAAIQQARATGDFWTLTINGGTNGGITGIVLKIEKKVK